MDRIVKRLDGRYRLLYPELPQYYALKLKERKNNPSNPIEDLDEAILMRMTKRIARERIARERIARERTIECIGRRSLPSTPSASKRKKSSQKSSPSTTHTTSSVAPGKHYGLYQQKTCPCSSMILPETLSLLRSCI